MKKNKNYKQIYIYAIKRIIKSTFVEFIFQTDFSLPSGVSKTIEKRKNSLW